MVRNEPTEVPTHHVPIRPHQAGRIQARGIDAKGSDPSDVDDSIHRQRVAVATVAVSRFNMNLSVRGPQVYSGER